MNKMTKVSGVLVAAMLAGSIGMADDHGRDYRGDRDRDRGHGDYGRNYHGYYDCGRHYGYYHNSRGELVFGLLGLGVAAAIVSSMDRPAVVYQSPPVVYVQQPPVVQAPQLVYQAAPVVQQPVVVETPQPVSITINIQNSNGSFTPVILLQIGSQWVGPKGEYYNGLPSVGQLRPLYGF
jgi:hypothetical protein